MAGKVSVCGLFKQSVITKQEISEELSISVKTVIRYCKDEYGVRKLLEAMRRRGYCIVLDKDNGKLRFYQKIRFEDRLEQAQQDVKTHGTMLIGAQI